MTITPDQAATLAANYVEPHEMPDCPDAVELWESSYDLAQTIAGMTEQWRAEYREIWGAWLAVSDWTTEDKARLALAPDQFKDATTRLVRRLVGPVEVIDE